MRSFVVVILLLFGIAVTLLAGAVMTTAGQYRSKWYEPKDFERGAWVRATAERRAMECGAN